MHPEAQMPVVDKRVKTLAIILCLKFNTSKISSLYVLVLTSNKAKMSVKERAHFIFREWNKRTPEEEKK